MRVMPHLLGVVFVTSVAASAAASAVPADRHGPSCAAEAPAAGRAWRVSFDRPAPVAPRGLDLSSAQTERPRRAVAVDYSDAYKVRARIHKLASIATIPVFGAMYWVGQDLYDHPGASELKKALHSGLAAATGVLFGANTLTGAWNLWEGRKDPAHRTKRMAHGLLMMVADAGFVATGLLAPDDEHESRGVGGALANDRRTHRTVALTSMGVATVSYLLMLVGGN